MTDRAPPSASLKDEFEVLLIGLRQARRVLGEDGLAEAEALWPRLERCARRLEQLPADERRALQPLMLALLDELQQTVAVFDAGHRDLGDRLRSANRSLAAGAAYRKASTA